MPKILMIYGTAYGQTERITRRIGDGLNARGHSVSIYRGDSLPKSLRLDEYEGVVIAASVIGGRYQPYIQRFIGQQSTRLNAIRSAFVSVSGTARDAPAEAQALMNNYLIRTGWHPMFTASFAGAIVYTRYNPVLRWIMRMISRHHGGPTDPSRDFEMTDWAAVDLFAERLADALSTETTPLARVAVSPA